jgi:hypothetical protein
MRKVLVEEPLPGGAVSALECTWDDGVDMAAGLGVVKGWRGAAAEVARVCAMGCV